MTQRKLGWIASAAMLAIVSATGMALAGPVTTTTTTTSTTVPAADPSCPDRGTATLHGGISVTACANNGDCTTPPGECNTTLGVCVRVTALATGWTGAGHGADINDGGETAVFLNCPGPAPVCGECIISGISPELDNCRCSNDILTVCDEPFSVDFDDCGGEVCDCYLDAPLPLTSGGVAACAVNRIAEDITGTANVDLGAGQASVKLKTRVYLGAQTVTPCPYCGGACSADTSVGCATDAQCSFICDSGLSVCASGPKSSDPCANNGDCSVGPCTDTDDVARDGIRNGTCVGGDNDGNPCDAMTPNYSYPAPGGGSHSLDCQPDVGRNVSGAGLVINLNQGTGTAVPLASDVECSLSQAFNCQCRSCAADVEFPCSQDSACADAGLGLCKEGTCVGRPAVVCGSAAECIIAESLDPLSHDKPELGCRKQVGKNAAKYAKTTLKVLRGCHKNNAKSGAGDDCNSLAVADLAKGKAEKGRTKFRSLIGGSKDKCSGVAPSDVLYDICPAGDAGTCAATLTTFSEVADCLICLTDATVEALGTVVLGTPPSPIAATDDAKCNDTVVKDSSKYFSTIMKDVTSCQAKIEKGGATTLTDCLGSLYPSDKVTKSQSKAEAKIASVCGAADLGALSVCLVVAADTCATDDAGARGLTLATQALQLGPGRGECLLDSCSDDSECTASGTDRCLLCAGGLAAEPNQCRGSCSGEPTEVCSFDVDCAHECDKPGTELCLTGPMTGAGCTTNGDCDAGPCLAYQCEDQGVLGNNVGLCSSGPDDRFCDGVVTSAGGPLFSCVNNTSCTEKGLETGLCTGSQRRSCFLPTITGQGSAHEEYPVGVALFCVPQTGASGINSAAGLPGPGRIINQLEAKTFCPDGVTQYVPGVGGCP